MNLSEQLPWLDELIRQIPLAVREGIIQFLLIVVALLVIYLLRRVIAALLLVPLRALVSRSPNNTDDLVMNLAQNSIRLLVIAIALLIVLALFDFSPNLEQFGNSLVRALIIGAIMTFLLRLIDTVGINSAILYRITGISIQDRLLPFLRTILKVFILVIGSLIILQEFNFDVTGLIASFGVVGLALSLAAQDTASNVFGFTAIVSDNPFQVGDFIVTADFSGIVEHVGVRSTRVRKLDQSLVIVPNNTLANNVVTNWSRLTKRRIDFIIGLTYDTTSQQMTAVLDALRQMLRERPQIDPDSVVVLFNGFGDSSLDIRLIAYSFRPDWTDFNLEQEAIYLEIMRIVEGHGLSFAFPSRSLYIESLPRMNGEEKPITQSIPIPAQKQREIRSGSDHSEQDNEAESSNGGDEER